MKLKYKKIILLTTMSTMGIGLLTLSLNHDKTDAEESLSNNITAEAVASDETAVEENKLMSEDTAAAITAALTPEPTYEPTPSPEPTPLPVYDIEEDGYPKITKLIEEYYSAKNNSDVDALKVLLSDPSKADTQEQLQQKTEYIDDYSNIKVYVKKGYIQGTYIVYAYHEIKFTGINTAAPGLAKFYIITDNNNELKIFSGTMDADVKEYYDARNSDEDVVALINLTDKKSDKAIESDEDLLNFWKNIDEMAGNSDGSADASADASSDTSKDSAADDKTD